VNQPPKSRNRETIAVVDRGKRRTVRFGLREDSKSGDRDSRELGDLETEHPRSRSMKRLLLGVRSQPVVA
jgi:hypothetical protein